MAEIKFTRQDLYELVWSESMLSLSKRYDISDNGLRKICKRMEIPLPANGHWQKVQYGKDVIKQKLPKNSTVEQEVTLQHRAEGSKPGSKTTNEVAKLAKVLENMPGLHLKVSEKLTNPDKLIIIARETLQKDRASEYSKWMVSTSLNELNITVSKPNISRALRIMDTIIKALRARGYEIKGDHKTCVVIHNEDIKFRLREKYKREANPKSTSMWDQYIYNPTSVLVFKIESWYREYDFIDGKCQLEELIPQIIAKIELIGDYLLQRRIESDRAREEQKEKERIRQEQLRIKELELKNFKKLLQSASRWHQAAFIRTFLTDFELISRKAGTFTEEKKSWIEWAMKKVDWYDPLVESYDNILKDVDRNTLL